MLSFISNLLPIVYAEEEKHQEPTSAVKEEEEHNPTAEEIEDYKLIWTACEQSSACAPLQRQLDQCAKRETFKEGDCLEELHRLLQCVFECSLPESITIVKHKSD
ncbi:hypothetical protein BGZ95_006452 [Linnemannia exigua]|uniref:Ubiquinol-cytochrome C reductase hinge domain-containing protein n=1 Tax=Linnemannia exigua TaxID=604196 RepID=A0AAD4DMU5_9FUNG|nr:hypothetical protein BGZ95_006452 [Linnemannia exigua]